MRKTTTSFVIILCLLSFSAAAYGLDSYPKPFASSGKVDTIIVVGDKAPASHVIAQTNLALALGQEADVQAFGVSKLASEVTDLEQNIISIGNPCDNAVSASLLGDPKPCDKGYAPGKASIMVNEKDGKVRLIVAGFTDKGTQAAANALKSYGNIGLKGTLYTIDVDEPTDIPSREAAQNASDAGDQQEEEQTEAPQQEERQEQQGSAPEESGNNTETVQSFTQDKEGNVFARFFHWLTSLFG